MHYLKIFISILLTLAFTEIAMAQEAEQNFSELHGNLSRSVIYSHDIQERHFVVRPKHDIPLHHQFHSLCSPCQIETPGL